MTFCVPEFAEDSVVVPLLKVTVVAPDVVHVRSKLLPAPTAAVSVHVTPEGNGVTGGRVFAAEQAPPAPEADKVYVVVPLGVTIWVPNGEEESVEVPSVRFTVVAFVVLQSSSKLPAEPPDVIRLQVGAAGTGEPGVRMIDFEQLPPAPIAFNV